MYRNAIYIMREVMLEDIAPRPQEWLGTPTTSMPPGSCQILAVCSSLALGSKRRCWAIHMLALGSRRQCWLCMLVFSSNHRFWVVHAGIGLYTPAFFHGT